MTPASLFHPLIFAASSGCCFSQWCDSALLSEQAEERMATMGGVTCRSWFLLPRASEHPEWVLSQNGGWAEDSDSPIFSG